MSAVDFNAILDTKAEEIKSKPPIPVGTYGFVIKGLTNIESSQKKTPGIEFEVETFKAYDDVDAELLAESGGLQRTLKHTLYVTAESANMLKEFLSEHCGIDATGKTLRQLVAESTNATFAATVEHGISKNGRTFAQIAKTMALS